MDEYISRHEAIRAVQLSYGNYEATRKALYEIPAADVEPVRRGSWKYHDDINFWRCSCCGVNAPIAGDFMQLKTNYCSYCGARMDGAKNE